MIARIIIAALTAIGYWACYQAIKIGEERRHLLRTRRSGDIS